MRARRADAVEHEADGDIRALGFVMEWRVGTGTEEWKHGDGNRDEGFCVRWREIAALEGRGEERLGAVMSVIKKWLGC